MCFRISKIFFIIIILNSASFSNDRNKPVKIITNGDALIGDTGPLVKCDGVVQVNDRIPTPPMTFSVDAVTWTITEVSPDARTLYDLQSNGVVRYIVQNSANPSQMHAVFMVATDETFGNRNVRYFYTTNGGVSWDYLLEVNPTRSGFPCITITSDGRAIVLSHNNDAGAPTRISLMVDAAPGAGTWTPFNPGAPDPSLGIIWPSAFCSSNNKVLFAGSKNGQDSAFRNVCTLPAGSFLGWQLIPECETAEGYSVACGTTKWGIAYNTFSGGAKFIESTNQGVTWGAPITIVNWNPLDSIGTLRSIDLTYQGDNPMVTIGLGHVEPIGGSFVPSLWSKQCFWSPNINGGNLITIDSAAGVNGSNPQNDVFFSVCRGVIGRSITNDYIYIAYNKARSDTSASGNNFFDIWFRYSTDGGTSWSAKTQLTNTSGPLRDWRYPSISPTNHVSSPNHYAHIIAQMDSIPGSFVGGAAPSWARMMYIRITISPSVGIKQINSNIPSQYSLFQNYPNPFNPKTQIEFALPKQSFVTIVIYNSLGQQITELVKENINAGSYRVNWDAANYPSGIYFYSLSADKYYESKKMILVK